LGKPIVWGARTYDSIGKALPGRKLILLFLGMGSYKTFAGRHCGSLVQKNSALAAVKDAEEVMIIGAVTIYETFYPYVIAFILLKSIGSERRYLFSPTITGHTAGKTKVLSNYGWPETKNPHDYQLSTLEKIRFCCSR